MRNIAQDELWLRAVGKECAQDEVLYVTPAYYDGGYELRIGTVTVFVEYEVIDENDRSAVLQRYQKKL
jgi:hypothetical protein